MAEIKRKLMGNGSNQLLAEDRPVHDWFRFVLSYPPHLVREYLGRFDARRGQFVLDPFCGTGTTVVECKKLGIASIGLEVNPAVAAFARTKTDWAINPRSLETHARGIYDKALEKLHKHGLSDNGELFSAAQNVSSCDAGRLRTLPEESMALLIKNSISPLPLHKAIVLLETIEESKEVTYHQHERLALAKTVVYGASNLHFGPEVGVSRVKKQDAGVISAWLNNILQMCRDLRVVADCGPTEAAVRCEDSRTIAQSFDGRSVDTVITSPPYPNEKDYTRTTRLESVLLGYISTRQDLRDLKKSFVRSNTRGVFAGDEDDKYIRGNPRIENIARDIEIRRIELGKTSGFERLYGRLTKLYFGGMARHFAELRERLSPGARLAYVVGDQASYLRVMIRTGQLLGEIAESLGYEVTDIDLFRTRLSTTTGEQLREEVLLLRWPG
ncbi:MAG: DNA methyltransferase [Candidatus Zixiibacteriota bacterium]